eukprot:3398379-Prymnesium_polylepis.1
MDFRFLGLRQRNLSPLSISVTRYYHRKRYHTGADGSARYVDGTRRLPISPRIDTYLVPVTAPQGA